MVGSTKYKDFIILNKEMNKDNLDSMIKVLSRAKDTMINPRMLHFVSEIVDIDAFPNKFIQSLDLFHKSEKSLEQQPTLENLSNIFKQKVIPQLQEYFFDDWAKINLVLNGNGMLKPKPVETSAIFPNEPYRVCRRVNILRDYPDDKIKIYP
ncbi:hypothetical protein ACG9XX_14240 [Acinetobacter baumannii]